MNIYGLFANEPLVKRYFKNADGSIDKSAYPMVGRFTSVNFGNDLGKAIVATSLQFGCLLKGELDRDLKNEPRAGHTSPNTPTSWVCLDLDGVEGYADATTFLHDIGCGDVDYIIQWSNSAGLYPGLRCHIFMALEKPESPALLKRWLKHLNLSTPTLRSQMTLNKIDTALRWPLDVTTCQNDKLIYIAPPVLNDIEDPFAGRPRIEVARRTHPRLQLPAAIPEDVELSQQEAALVQELRVAKGLKPLAAAFYEGARAILDPEAAQITGMKIKGKFRYFNLNGGDSWGYYQPISNPIWVHNFKGEPKALTKELLPEFWGQITAELRQ